MLRQATWLAALGFAALALATAADAGSGSWRQPPTVAIPTVTGTPTGPTIIAVEQVNVRAGPGVDYERVGVLLPNQQVPAVGRSPGGDWIQISYPGVPGNVAWVYAFNVTLITGPGTLSVVEPPPTPTLRATATIDPTLAAQFPNLGQLPPTRMPTFTSAAPVVWPTFEAAGGGASGRGFPPILAILGLLLLGGFGTLFTFLRSR